MAKKKNMFFTHQCHLISILLYPIQNELSKVFQWYFFDGQIHSVWHCVVSRNELCDGMVLDVADR